MEKTALLTTFAAALLAAAQSATAPSVGRAVPREEIAKTWRLIARDIEMHDKARPLPRRDVVVRFTTFQPPEAEVANREALILKEDRDPLDVLLRRTRALYADLSGQVDLSKEGKALDEIAAAASAASFSATARASLSSFAVSPARCTGYSSSRLIFPSSTRRRRMSSICGSNCVPRPFFISFNT